MNTVNTGKAKVLESKANNEIIFQQREILGFDELTVIHRFVRKVLIEENMVKYKFNEHWDPRLKKYKESIVGLIVGIDFKNLFNCWDNLIGQKYQSVIIF